MPVIMWFMSVVCTRCELLAWNVWLSALLYRLDCCYVSLHTKSLPNIDTSRYSKSKCFISYASATKTLVFELLLPGTCLFSNQNIRATFLQSYGVIVRSSFDLVLASVGIYSTFPLCFVVWRRRIGLHFNYYYGWHDDRKMQLVA